MLSRYGALFFNPVPSSNQTYTNLGPSPGISVHDFDVVYGSHEEHGSAPVLVLLIHIRETPLAEYDERDNVTASDVVVAAPLLIDTDPAG